MLVKKKLLSIATATLTALALAPVGGVAYAEEAIVVEADPVVVESNDEVAQSTTNDDAVIIQEDSWTAELYAKAVYNTGATEELVLNDGATLHLHPNQKACVAFLTNGEENLQHGLTPIAGWHDTITDEYGNIVKSMGDLSKLGFDVKSGTLAELGYSGRLTNDHGEKLPDDTFLIEIGQGTVAAGKTGTLRYYLYPYSGNNFWADFAKGDFKFSNTPSQQYTYTLDVVVAPIKTVTTKATLKANGSVVTTCSVCGEVFSSTMVSHPNKFSLKKTTYTYNGEEREPKVTVKDANGKTISAENYTVTYSNNIKASTKKAKAKAKIKFLNNYSGTKTLTFTINKAANTLKVAGKLATVEYSKVKSASQKLDVKKVLSFSTKGKGTMSYTKTSGNKKITINKKTGKVTIKKGLKQGTYPVQIKVKAAGNANYKASATKKITFWIRVL